MATLVFTLLETALASDFEALLIKESGLASSLALPLKYGRSDVVFLEAVPTC